MQPVAESAKHVTELHAQKDTILRMSAVIRTKHIRGVYVSVYRMIQVYMTGIQVIGGYPVVTTQQK